MVPPPFRLVTALINPGPGNLATVTTLGVKVAVEESLLPAGFVPVLAVFLRRTGVSWRTADFLIVCWSRAFTSMAGQATSETLRHKELSTGDELRLCFVWGLRLKFLQASGSDSFSSLSFLSGFASS